MFAKWKIMKKQPEDGSMYINPKAGSFSLNMDEKEVMVIKEAVSDLLNDLGYDVE